MNEQHFARQVRHHLDLGAGRLDPTVEDRLFKARQQALARHKAAVSTLGLSGIGHIGAEFLMPHGRTLAALIALILAVVALSYWGSVEHAAEIEEIDVALLVDDLPINAYLDRGFDAWLKDSSQQ